MTIQEKPIRVLFICGCLINPDDVEHVDSDGFVHCPFHPGFRRYGWRTRRKTKRVDVVGKSEDDEYMMVPDYSRSLEDEEKLFWMEKGVNLTKDDGSYQILRPSPVVADE